jgi:oxygen-independent coproporphyrinogen-3 oxidase
MNRTTARQHDLTTARRHEDTTAPRHELGIYLHIPFCVRKCYYCDFNSGPLSQTARGDYLEALRQEIRHSPWKGCEAKTVFFGGGTPSELSVAELGTLVDDLRQTFQVKKEAEWSIECNPGTVTRAFFAALGQMGFNRVSLGVQSFHDHHLRDLGRVHTSAETRETYRHLREAGCDNVNLDLMFGLPNQTLQEWESDLSEALSLSPEHLSLYNLTIEPGTEFGNRYARGELREVDEDLCADMYELAMERTREAGYRQYEISNYSRPGRQCAHNFIYWHNEPYLGFGVSAASFMDGLRWTNTGNLREYAQTASSGRVSRASEEALEDRAALGEEIMLRLRTCEGISLSALSTHYHFDVASLFAQTLHFLSAQRFITRTEDRVRLTRRGKMVANEVCLRFLA